MDLAVFLENVSVTDAELLKSIHILEIGVKKVVAILGDAALKSEDWKRSLALDLRQDFSQNEEGHQKQLDQLLAIATTIMINAMLFQQKLAGNSSIKSVEQLQMDNNFNSVSVSQEWTKILDINYWSIFNVAKDLLLHINPPDLADQALKIMGETSRELINSGVADSHDLAGSVFQRFIGDRKFLASFYTRTESATLLANLAIPEDGWGSPNKLKNFKIADYACGTGTLIHAAYSRVTQLHRLSEGDDPEKFHGYMMENSLTGLDIVPSAAHLTASMLSSMYPNSVWKKSRIFITEYGDCEDQGVAIGSIELLDKLVLPSLFPISSPIKIEGTTEKVSDSIIAPDYSEDLVIMNPPYSRAMSDWTEGSENTWKQYRGLTTSEETQKVMKQREKEILRGTCFHGSAGLGSAFVAIADRKVKFGGSIALVLPLTSMHGVSWSKVRNLLSNYYNDLMCIAISDKSGATAQSWSSDTNMAEVLIVGKKSNKLAHGKTGIFITLNRSPSNKMEAVEFSRSISRTSKSKKLNDLKDGPVGGTPISIGDEIVGEAITASLKQGPWSWIPVKDQSLSQAIYSLGNGLLFFPRMDNKDSKKINIVPIEQFGQVGFAANVIANNQHRAFDRKSISNVPTYPMLWKNDSKIQRQFVVFPDQEGTVRMGKDDLASRIWERRSHFHICAEFGFATQSLCAVLTPERTIGGRGWPNVKLPSIEHEMALGLWANCSLGLMLYWFHGGRQQGKRVIMPVSQIAKLPFLDVTLFSNSQLEAAVKFFNKLKDREFLAASEAYRDKVRIELDNFVCFDLIDLNPIIFSEPLALLRSKWCSDPSVKK